MACRDGPPYKNCTKFSIAARITTSKTQTVQRLQVRRNGVAVSLCLWGVVTLGGSKYNSHAIFFLPELRQTMNINDFLEPDPKGGVKLSQRGIFAIIVALLAGCFFYWLFNSSDATVKNEPSNNETFYPVQSTPAKPNTVAYQKKTSTDIASVNQNNTDNELTPEQLQRKKDFGKLDAFTASHEFVKEKLISPSSAEFFYSYENAVTKINDSTWFVDSFVDSQNEYGAMIKKRFVCKLTYNPVTDTEHCLDVELLPVFPR